ncbi:hypothetical protein JOD63_000367 [Microbacterium terrae]|uniref:Uncharacterized protein n=1 Tax=Microbacterium terrae TaxID=69369 RepID=A0A0M2H1X8_9MICO|nr:hypothetical protein [Microbacterium terrae]KJL37568.1 hypothetical protein RS81_03325 [Microbacterium terrae]MBP1076399.1 hypothetical protein [Microbacterium terrae]GLJ97225.1 hypothetical protein GCM10017594_04220 [Microbacterium terrae]
MRARAGTDTPSDEAEQRWISVVFLQGDDADEVLDLIELEGSAAAITHLSAWDDGDETTDAALVNGYVYDEVPWTTTDRVELDDRAGYALTYNRPFGYVSLLRRFAAEPEPALVAPARALAEPWFSASIRLGTPGPGAMTR